MTGTPENAAVALSLPWGLPFAGLLLSIAALPLLAPHFWHSHYGKVCAAWVAALLAPLLALHGVTELSHALGHALLGEYIPFIVLLTALYTVAGGIHIRGHISASPLANVIVLALGALLASFMGTTGASMLLIRPLIRANENRRHKAHIVVFFIFIVSNAGGALTPLGDPPLFLGFLQGVGFFWTLAHIWQHTLFLIGALLLIFYLLDTYHFSAREEFVQAPRPPGLAKLHLDGGINLLLLPMVMALVLMSALWKSPVSFDVAGATVALPNLMRDLGLVAITLLSFATTPRRIYQSNQFDWEPMREVAKLFVGIFITIGPVVAMLKLGAQGPFAAVVSAVTRADGTPDALMYFWACGLLSSVLDNAPTYLVFFNTASGDAQVLMHALAPTLAAISAGAVFMGANTYIGNAPNLMVKSIAQSRGVAMPSFFAYMAWSGAILLPLFALMGWIWFRS